MAEKLGAAVYEDGWWMDLAIGADAGGYSTYFPNTLNSLINYANYFVVDKTGQRILNVNALYGPRSIARLRTQWNGPVKFSQSLPGKGSWQA